MLALATTAVAGAMIAAAPTVNQVSADTTDAADTSGYVTAASYRAAEPTPEILGISNIASNLAWNDENKLLNWGAPYFYLFDTSEYNSNPNPYMENSINQKSSSMVLSDKSRNGGPMASLKTYSDATAVWNMLPDVIVGNQSKVNYNSDDYAKAAAEAQGKSSYKTYGAGTGDFSDGNYGVNYDSTNIYTMLDTTYYVAKAGEDAAAGTGKKLRMTLVIPTHIPLRNILRTT